MKIIPLLFTSLTITSFFASCKKSSNSTGSGNVDVYVAGFDNGDLVYWKNGKENWLGTAAPGYYGSVSGITCAT